VQAGLDLGQTFQQLRDLAAREIVHRSIDDVAGQRQQFALERASLRRQVDMPFPAIVFVARPANQALPLHDQDRAQRGRLHGADPVGQLALGQAVLVPERPQEIPHAERNVVRLDLELKEALKQAVGGADLITDALGKR
jgi:hypothetical protein